MRIMPTRCLVMMVKRSEPTDQSGRPAPMQLDRRNLTRRTVHVNAAERHNAPPTAAK